jgi:hypothetical protein
MSLVLRPGLAALLLLGAASIAAAADKTAAEKTAADLFPATTIAYAEVTDPGKVSQTLAEHPLVATIIASPEYRAAVLRPEVERFLATVSILEAKLGEGVRPAAEKLAARGLYVGFDLASQGLIVLARASDQAHAEKVREAFIEMVRKSATDRGMPDPVQSYEHQGLAGHQLGGIRITVHDGWVVVSNKPLAQAFTLNNLLGKDPQTLASEPQFAAALAKRPAGTAWGYLDLRLIRSLANFEKLAGKKSDNPAVELLAGGIISALPQASYVTVTTQVQRERISLELSLPCNLTAAAEKKEFYFGPAGQGIAPPLLQPTHSLLSLSTYRDFASLWHRAPDLFDDAVNAKFVEASAGLKTIFGGRDFADDILDHLQPGMQIVVSRQVYGDNDVMPAIRFPAAALVVRMKNPAETARTLKITFQNLVGFGNIAAGQNGVDPLDLNSEKVGDALVVSSEYLPPDDESTRRAAPPQYNVSPTAVFVGDQFILASTKALALELKELVTQVPASQPGINTAARVDGPTLHAVLSDNQSHLVAQNMLEKGHDREAAEKEIGVLLALTRHLGETSLRLGHADGALNLRLEATLNAP